MKKFLFLLCMVILPAAAFAQWDYPNKAISDSADVLRTELKAAISDTADVVRGQVILKDELADSLATDYGIEELGTAWVDSSKIKDGSVSAADLRAVSVDSTKVKPTSIAGSNLVSPLRVPTYDVYVRYLSAADSLAAKSLALTSYLIVDGPAILKGGATITGTITATVAQADTFKTIDPAKYALPLTEFGLAATDSAGAFTSYAVGRDTTVTTTRQRLYLDFTRGPSTSLKNIILSGVFTNFPVLNPDSLVFDIYSTSASADSIKVRVRIKNGATTDFNSGWIDATAANTWEHYGFVLPTPFTKSQEYEVLIDVQAREGYRTCLAALQVK